MQKHKKLHCFTQLYDVFGTNEKVYIVLQLYNNTDLFEFLTTNTQNNNYKIDETYAKWIFYQIS